MVERKDTKKIQQVTDDRNRKEKLIANQWATFSETAAYKDLMEYITGIHDLWISYAKERVMPHPSKAGEEIILDNEMSNVLLQNARGSDIVRTYVESYVNSQA